MTNIPKDERKNYIGGTEVAALFGLSPYSSAYRLYHIKKGNIPDDIDETERMAAGKFLEPAIAAWAMDKWPGFDLRKVNRYIIHPDQSRLGVSLDYETETGSPRRPVDIKNVDGLVFSKSFVVEDGEIIDAPMHMVLQVQAQMACTGAPEGYLVVCVGGNKLLRMKVARHDGAIRLMLQKVAQFWKMVDDNIEPPPDFTIDAATIKELNGVTRKGDVKDLTGDNLIGDLVDVLTTARERKKGWDAAVEAAAAEILHKMGDAEIGRLPDGRLIKAPTRQRKEYTVEAGSYREVRITNPKEE